VASVVVLWLICVVLQSLHVPLCLPSLGLWHFWEVLKYCSLKVCAIAFAVSVSKKSESSNSWPRPSRCEVHDLSIWIDLLCGRFSRLQWYIPVSQSLASLALGIETFVFVFPSSHSLHNSVTYITIIDIFSCAKRRAQMTRLNTLMERDVCWLLSSSVNLDK